MVRTMGNKDVVKRLRSLGVKMKVDATGKVMVSGKRKIPRRGRGAAPSSTVQGIMETLNTAKKGTLLGMVAEAMRAASRAVGHLPEGDSAGAKAIRREVRQQRQTGIVSAWNQRQFVDRFSELNKILARHSVTIQVMPTVNKPVRLLLAPQSNNRDMASVVKIITASEAGGLDRLKACDYCQRFFVAGRDWDRFCPGTYCRKNWHRKTAAGKKQNAKNQSEFRKARAALDRRALAAARADWRGASV